MKKQADRFRRVGLIGNPDKAACAPVVHRAAQLIQTTRRQLYTDAQTARRARLQTKICGTVEELARAVDLLMVFGGDGTMLRIARQTAGIATPLLGVNIGGLGFLTEVPSAELEAALALIWRGNFKCEQRALIEARARIAGRQLRQLALNDVVVGRGEVARLIDLEVEVNQDPLTRYRCDGLIVSSPTGSTAYSLAAGGAVVLPTAEVFALTPICPHTLTNRSLIVPLSAKIRIRPANAHAQMLLSADGEILGSLSPGDEVVVQRSRHTTRLMHLADSSFFAALRRKLHWRGTNF
ncbi:MAG TPA: NAD(+)/NADH kinase [Verrucomicrobiota bacterium]|nr:NAD(+)/NADH kinase [Verrucomicrobiota bacterium]HNT14694.1 NAD(+)/NADH kinase [Verrucomicrobiota bacterium]